MRASFLIRWHTRRIDNLLQQLRLFDLWHKDVVEQSELLLLCHDRCGDIKTNFLKTTCYNFDFEEMFITRQTNVGVNQALSDNIIMLDGDRIPVAGYFNEVLDQLVDNTMISTSNVVKLTNFCRDEEIETCDSFQENRTINTPCTRCMWAGNIVFKKEDFLRAGSMDESYIGYGFEDIDMTLAMEAVGVKSILRNDKEYHLYHEMVSYGSKNQKQLFIENGKKFCKKWKKPFPPCLAKELRMFI